MGESGTFAQPDRGSSYAKAHRDPDNRLTDYVEIYVDNIFQGDPETLPTITAQSVREIEHYDAAQAQRLGSRGHPHGPIVVRTRTR